VSGQCHAPTELYPRGKGPPVPIGQEAGWAPELVWTQRLEEKNPLPLPGIEPGLHGRPVRRRYSRNVESKGGERGVDVSCRMVALANIRSLENYKSRMIGKSKVALNTSLLKKI
jgi:hypothetical protein